MSNKEFRVRPVVRYVVTEYAPRTKADPCGTSRVVGEFANEEQAEIVRETLEFQHAPRQFVMVKRGFELDTQAQYADTQEEADAFVAEKLAQEEEWRIYSRVITDPIAKARASLGLAQGSRDAMLKQLVSLASNPMFQINEDAVSGELP